MRRRLRAEEQKPEQREQWSEDGQGPFYDVAEEGWAGGLLMHGDRTHHEIGAVANVGGCAEENCADADGFEKHIQMVSDWIGAAEDHGEEGQVGGGIVEHPGEQTTDPIICSNMRGTEDVVGIETQPVEDGHHGGKDGGEKDDDFDHRMPVEVVGVVDGFPGCDPGDQGGGDHDGFAQEQGFGDEHSSQNDGQTGQVGQAFEFPFVCFVRQFRRARSDAPYLRVVAAVEHVEDCEQEADSNQPHGPAFLDYPPEGHAFQITEEERRIADGRETAADVRDYKNEKHDVMGRGPMLVHAQPRPNEQHRGTGCAQDIRKHCADEEEENVQGGGGLAAYVDVDAAGNDVERADERDEAEVFVSGMEDGGYPAWNGEQVVCQCDRSKR